MPVSFPFGVGNPERKPLFTLPSLSPLFQALPVGRSSCSSFLTSVGWSSLLPTHTIAGTPPDRAARCLHRHNVYIISCIFPTITPSNELMKIIKNMMKLMFSMETADSPVQRENFFTSSGEIATEVFVGAGSDMCERAKGE